MGKSTISMAMFNSYVSLPEGTSLIYLLIKHGNMVKLQAMLVNQRIKFVDSQGILCFQLCQVYQKFKLYTNLENQNPENSSGQHKNLRYFGKNKKTRAFD